ncbi:MAG: hypothetical protein ACI9EF_000164 [Pseudohongiellaceae bacterium]|jgi:hypothetical protein
MADSSTAQFPEATLTRHLFDMAQQAAIALGEIENPITKRIEQNPEAARYIIEVLVMLQEKTASNCTQEEGDYISGAVASLKTLYVQKIG